MFPYLLGARKSLFSYEDNDRRDLRLRDSTTYSNGVVSALRRPALTAALSYRRTPIAVIDGLTDPVEALPNYATDSLDFMNMH